ncbi:MAG: CidA/LrgA family protein [Proteobacteria bacterium]|nr:CidA/LrgA family protein [Pseudomonadota bacterium]
MKKEISETSHQIINYLSLLFVPIGVGVVMHINYLGDNLFKILAIIIIGTLSTLVFVAYVMEKIINLEKNNVKRR